MNAEPRQSPGMRQGAGNRLRIAVIGGSISGCMVGQLLLQAGHEVRIFERSQTGLTGRGGGVATSSSVLDAMQAQQLIGTDFPRIHHGRLRLAKRTAAHAALGRCPWMPALDMACVHWTGLFNALRERIPDASYFLGKELIDVVRGDGECGDGSPDRQASVGGGMPVEPQVRLHFADGAAEPADLVVFTDGFRSLGRQLMYPEVALDYRGFAVWRGVLDERHVSAAEALIDHPRISYVDMPGSFITYLMPGADDDIRPGKRVINWAAYLPVTAAELPRRMIDSAGVQRQGTVPAGFFPVEAEAQLQRLMQSQLPGVFADIVSASVDTQFQPIRITSVPGHYHQRLCLVGDAAVTIQPLTGAGLFKAFEDARTLAAALPGVAAASGSGEPGLGDRPPAHASREASLQAWSARQTDLDQRLLATGHAMEEAFIWNTIDLATATADDVEAWWRRSIVYPPEYSYLDRSAAAR